MSGHATEQAALKMKVKPVKTRVMNRRLVLAVVLCLASLVSAPAPAINAPEIGWIRWVGGATGPDNSILAKDKKFGAITALGKDSIGRVLVGTADGRVHRISSDNTTEVVAGTGFPSIGVAIEGPALSTRIPPPRSLLGLADGSVLVGFDNNISRLRGDGVLERWANSEPSCTYSPSSTRLGICGLAGMAADLAGNVYVSDNPLNLIQRVRANGTVERVAGDGAQGFGPSSGDGGPAVSAILTRPDRPVYWQGAIYFHEFPFNVRRIRADGIIETVPSLSPPSVLTGGSRVYNLFGVGPTGDLLVQGGSRVVSVTPSGASQVVAGGGSFDLLTGALATNVNLGNSFDAVGLPDGNVAVAINGYGLVYQTGSTGSFTRIAGAIRGQVVAPEHFRRSLGGVVRSGDGSIVVWSGSFGGVDGGIWRFENGVFARVAGSEVPNSPVSPMDLAAGCGRDLMVNDYGRSLIRVDGQGRIFEIHDPFAENPSAPVQVVHMGGECGALYAFDYSGRLLRIGADDQVSVISNTVPIYVAGFRPDGQGGVYAYDFGPSLWHFKNGIWTNKPTSGRVIDVVPGANGSVFTLLATPLPANLISLVESSPGKADRTVFVNTVFSAERVPLLDGSAAVTPVAVSSIAYDPEGFLWMIDDHRFLRTVRVGRAIQASQASVSSVPPRGSASPAAPPNGTPLPRGAATAAG